MTTVLTPTRDQDYRKEKHHHYTAWTVCDFEDKADDTYYIYLDMAFIDACSFQGTLNCGAGTVTLTLEGTLQDDGTAAASCSYQDITNEIFGVASVVAAAGSSSFTWVDDSAALGFFRYLRVKLVLNTGGAGAQLGDATIFAIART